MTKEDKGNQPSEVPIPISRREFTKGSMAVIGAYSSLSQEQLPALSDEARALKLEISDDIRTLLDDRHILEDDIRRVIEHGEKTGWKLYQPGTHIFLSKLRVYEAMFYVEYSVDKDVYKIETAYSHRFKLDEE
jgi:glutamate synthase (NADPH/NADH) small chain